MTLLYVYKNRLQNRASQSFMFYRKALSCLILFSLLLLPSLGCWDMGSGNKAPVLSGNGAGYGGDPRGGNPPSGNGAGYGGGDQSLAYARQLLVRGLRQFKDGVALNELGNMNACRENINSPILCNLLVSLAPPQKEYLQKFLNTHLTELLDMNLGANRVIFEFTTNALSLNTSSGSTRDLAAKTTLGRAGNIVYNSDAVQVMNDWERLQLITHELGHKLEKIDSTHTVIDDDSVIGPFSSGKLFLDTLGAAMVGYLASSIRKVPVGFPKTSDCDANTIALTLSGAPYFSGIGQEAVGVLPVLKTLNETRGDFTLTAWVRVFDDLKESDKEYNGQVIFSNKDFSSGTHPGLQLFRLNNGNFGAYAGTGNIVDSGVKLVPGGFHLVSLKRNVDKTDAAKSKVYLSVDGISGNSASVAYFDYSEAKYDVARLIEVGGYSAQAMIGIAGKNQTNQKNYDFQRLDVWKGNIATLSLFDHALTDSEITSLFQCAPAAFRVETPKEVGPGYPVPSPKTDGDINVMVMNNKILYLGGSFRHIGEQVRSSVAALDIEKNNELTAFKPIVFGNVYAMVIKGNTLFIGGNFTKVNGVPRENLAAIDLTTGALYPWMPNPDNRVLSIAVADNYLFVGGDFDNINNSSTPIRNIASFNISDINNITLRTNWNVDPDDDVNALLVSGTMLYMGGYFWDVGITAGGTKINNQRKLLAAVDIETGALSPWNPDGSDGEVKSMALSGNLLYVGGSFSGFGEVDRARLAAIQLDDGVLTSWAPPKPNGDVLTIALGTSSLMIGGEFTELGGVERSRLAEVDLEGKLLDFNPKLDSYVYSLLLGFNKLYVGGSFSDINDKPSPYFGIISR